MMLSDYKSSQSAVKVSAEIIKDYLPFFRAQANLVNCDIPVIFHFMIFPRLSEYLVECWNWFKNVNNTEK